MEVAKRTFATLYLLNAVFLEINPKEFVESETEKWGLTVPFRIDFIPNVHASLSDIENFYQLLLKQTKEETLFIEEKNQRRQLLKQLEDFSDKLKPYVNLENSKK